MQMNMVEGFIPKGSFVQSFAVPYYCEDCDTESRQTMTSKDLTYSDGVVTFNSAPPKCAKGCELELDANEKKYFKFLSFSQSKAA